MNISNRIRVLRTEHLMLTQEEFANKIGLKQAIIGLYEKGMRSITDRTISDICREFNVDEHWLRTGEGAMFIEKTEDELLAEYTTEITLGNDVFIKNMIQKYMKLPDEHKKIIQNFFKEEL